MSPSLSAPAATASATASTTRFKIWPFALCTTCRLVATFRTSKCRLQALGRSRCRLSWPHRPRRWLSWLQTLGRWRQWHPPLGHRRGQSSCRPLLVLLHPSTLSGLAGPCHVGHVDVSRGSRAKPLPTSRATVYNRVLGRAIAQESVYIAKQDAPQVSSTAPQTAPCVMHRTIVAQVSLANSGDPQPDSLPQTKSKQLKLTLEGFHPTGTDNMTTIIPKLGDAPSGSSDMLQPSAGTMGRPQHPSQSC